MRFLLLLKSDADAEAGRLPGPAVLAAMARFHEELLRARVLLAAESLQPSSRGARVRFAAGARTVVDGPFPETRQLVAGYWMIEVPSLVEALAWAQRAPLDATGDATHEIEVRALYELGDFPAEVVARPNDALEAERLLRELEEQARPKRPGPRPPQG